MNFAGMFNLCIAYLLSAVLSVMPTIALGQSAVGSGGDFKGSLDAGKSDIQPERHALVVGINKYSPAYGPGDLNSCVADAEGVRNTILLGDPSNRWTAANIRMLTDERATKAGIRGALSDLAAASAPGDLVLYYQSGHGGQTEPDVDPTSTFVCAHDANYMDTELASDLMLFDSKVQVIVIIDACNSGGMFKNADGVREWPFARRVMAEYRQLREAELRSKGLEIPRNLGDNIAFMTSSNHDELSWETASHGMYTGYLLNGCALPAVDTNNDGEYQFMELHLYAGERAASATMGTGNQQNAQSYNDDLLRNTVVRARGSSALRAAGMNNDYSGDGKSDLALYHEETGLWFILSLDRGLVAWALHWGGPGFVPLTGDFDGDGTADLAVYHEATGQWYIWSLTKGLIAWGAAWGAPGLTPIAGDYSGDGKTDLALYDKTAGYWYVITLGGQPVMVGQSLAGAGFTAVPGDYSGNNTADFSVYHNGMGCWNVISSTGLPIVQGTPWGGAGLEPVPGDYDRNGFFDLAVYSRQTGSWYIWSHADNTVIAWDIEWGGEDFIPVPGDYNGNGVWDLAVYNQSTGEWFIRSVDGSEIIFEGFSFGGPGFVPVRSMR